MVGIPRLVLCLLSIWSCSALLNGGGPKFVIDTDPGVDDAQALLVALNNNLVPKPEILGIITEPGNAGAHQAARNAVRVLKLVGRTDIPVYIGVDDPLVEKHESDNYFGEDAFGDAPDVYPPFEKMDEQYISHESGVYQLIRLARRYPGEITLVALGPLTNIALALRLDPYIKVLFKNVIIMGGNIHGNGNVKPAVEFNFKVDPEAAFMVVRDMNATILTWEVVLENPVPWSWYDRYMSANNEITTFMHAIGGSVVDNRKKQGNHYQLVDGATMAVALNPNLITELVPKIAVVELRGTETRGTMVVDWREEGLPKDVFPNIKIIRKVNMAGIQDMVLQSSRTPMWRAWTKRH